MLQAWTRVYVVVAASAFHTTGMSGGLLSVHRYERRVALRPHEQREILFSVNGKCGYRLEDALKRRYIGLDGRDDRVFVDLEPTINIRLEVPQSV